MMPILYEDESGAYDANDIKQLIEDSQFLECLVAAGVDNWDGYGDAQEMLDGSDE